MKTSKGTIILSVVLVIALVAVGYIYFTSQSQIATLNSQLQASNLNINGKADIFDGKLHDLLQEHTFLLINTVRRSLDSSASYTASLVALQNNINQVGALLTPVYGVDSQQLVTLWNTKANIFLNYSTALKNNDPNANTAFNSAISAYEESIATFWANTNNPYPIFDKAAMKQMTTDHANNVKLAVDAWNAKDYPTYFSKLEIAYVQIGTYADTIANGIVQQHPELFK